MNNERKYSISFSKDKVKGRYVTRIEQEGAIGGVNIETEIDAKDSLIHHLEEIKDILELKIESFYNKLKANENKN